MLAFSSPDEETSLALGAATGVALITVGVGADDTRSGGGVVAICAADAGSASAVETVGVTAGNTCSTREIGLFSTDTGRGHGNLVARTGDSITGGATIGQIIIIVTDEADCTVVGGAGHAVSDITGSDGDTGVIN